ncbi:hypothetical protein [Aneurinibacillus migulanus]|uniref:hypothetical protein n=1 Tax=Aneurinibacillus migulanus TaxID=47500 RepID=UPI0011134AA7|nr:hypothetical protein [Aneurinibacillus migulanus]MED0895106.1 hypothetical protein [Aneurinibacillus migulanus]MED1615941.1 hypothetical protein [Aneurinibacillus migulanus]
MEKEEGGYALRPNKQLNICCSTRNVRKRRRASRYAPEPNFIFLQNVTCGFEHQYLIRLEIIIDDM